MYIRRMKMLLIGLILLWMTPTGIRAQQWSGIIDPSRAIDWSGAGVRGGIPNRVTNCATLSPGATAAQINNAIASCPAGQVVFLNAGTYNLSSGIDFANHSNVTLRGAGADQTFLLFTGTVSCGGQAADVCIQNGDVNWPGGPTHSANWTSGYSKGTTQIILDSTTGITPGTTMLVLDQLNDTSDNGTIFVCETGGVCAQEGPGGGDRTNRAQQQIVLVTGVSGNTVTITPGIYMPNWRSSQSPGAWWGNTVVQMDGIENLSMDHSSSTLKSGIMLFNAFNCWVKGIRSLNSNRNHVWFYIAAHNVVRDSYFYGTQNAASQSYGVEPYMSSDNLVENNIFQHIATPMQVSASSSGTVFGHNFTIDNYYSVAPTWMIAGNSLHAAGVDMTLFEGNESNALISDNIHGTHHFITAFRNQYIGWEVGKTSQTNATQVYQGSRYFNIIGNVLGKQGYHTSYQDLTPAGTNPELSIHTLGWSGNGGTNGCCANDVDVESTMLRWGNYDVVSNAVRWVASEVPTSLSAFTNLVPLSQNLPASFYLSSKPSWWGATPWPAIGPDVTGGSDTSGHVYANPAQICFNQTPKAGSGILNFSASTCYGSASVTRPAPPTNLSVVVH